MSNGDVSQGRRRFLIGATSVVGGVGVVGAAVPFVASWNPSAKAEAAGAPVTVNVSKLEPGQQMTVKWRGKPVFIRHRTAKEIAEAEAVDVSTLRDPQTDEERVIKKEWLIQIGICTHLGCVPKGQKVGDDKGDYNGWFCPCHGSHYDSAGRIRKGPAPLNLILPEYTFLTDEKIKIG